MATGGGGIADRRSANDSHVESLAVVFRCFVCMDQLKDARLCPHCSKMCCYQCINKWLNENRSQCPHCRQALQPEQLINMRFVDEVTEHLKSLQRSTNIAPSSLSDQCQTHEEKVSVYCETCQEAICHYCALFGPHTSHSFKQLDVIHRQHLDSVKNEMLKLQQRQAELVSLVEELEKNMNRIRTVKDDRVREIRDAVELMVARLDTQLRSKLATLQSHKSQLLEENENLYNLLNEIDTSLYTYSKSDLIVRSQELVDACKEVAQQRQPVVSLQPADFTEPDFTSEIVPTYDSATFCLRAFSLARQRADPVYSSPLQVNGLTWRLKVYPDGNGMVRGTYLSVFLEMTSGLLEPSKYEYKVEMVNQLAMANSDASRNIVREFSSEFEVGECWGYNRFSRLDLLASDGYLNTENDTLCLIFHVRAPNYYQKCRDQSQYIRELENKQRQALRQISSLRERNIGGSRLSEAEIAREDVGFNQSFEQNHRIRQSHPKQAHQQQSPLVSSSSTHSQLNRFEAVPINVEQVIDGDDDRSTTSDISESSIDTTGADVENGNENDVEEENMATDNDVESSPNAPATASARIAGSEQFDEIFAVLDRTVQMSSDEARMLSPYDSRLFSNLRSRSSNRLIDHNHNTSLLNAPDPIRDLLLRNNQPFSSLGVADNDQQQLSSSRRSPRRVIPQNLIEQLAQHRISSQDSQTNVLDLAALQMAAEEAVAPVAGDSRSTNQLLPARQRNINEDLNSLDLISDATGDGVQVIDSHLSNANNTSTPAMHLFQFNSSPNNNNNNSSA